jgi:hypothetical protein
MDESCVPETPEDWYTWLSNEETKTLESYLAKPANLIKEFRSERATSEDYKGREILELLQNAADQAKESSVKGRVVIELFEDGVVVANTGKAFSIGGVHSLQNHHLSPKRQKEKSLIGCKGLGFRSILNLTKRPLIHSGTLEIAYSQNYSLMKLDFLNEQNEELKKRVQKEQQNEIGIVFPVLPFPAFGKEYDKLNEDEVLRFKNRCHHWRTEGYDTAIGIPFENIEFYNDVISQIESLNPEVLLFVPYLDEIKFIIPNKDDVIWTKEGDDSASLVLANEVPLGIWQIFRDSGDVDEIYLENSPNKKLGYELIIAVPEYDKLDEPKAYPLYSYFPTEIKLPLPLVCHATFELDQSRNHLKKCKTNDFVFEKLAEFLAVVAEKRAQSNQSGVNAGFKNIMPLESFSLDFKDADFEALLMNAASTKRIIPTLGDTLSLPKDSMVLKLDSVEWLPFNGFTDVANATPKEGKFFINIGAQLLCNDELLQRFINYEWTDINQRISTIVGILKNKVHNSTHTSALLLATNQAKVPDGVRIFNSRRGIDLPELPTWQKLWFLDETMQASLMKRLNAKDVRRFQPLLSSFGLREYSLGSLIIRLVANTNSKKKEKGNDNNLLNYELITVIYQLYLAEFNAGSTPNFPPNTTVELESQSGEFVKAGDLYLSEGYGYCGAIVQTLFDGEDNVKLIAKPSVFDFCSDNQRLSSFFTWLGVNQWPKLITQKRMNINCEKSYLEFVVDSLNYPANFGKEYIFNAKDELPNSPSKLFLSSIETIDGLDKFLVPNKADAITAWLSKDARVSSLFNSTGEVKLAAKKGQDINERLYQGNLPSYIRWKLENTAWLVDKRISPIKPKDCIVIDRSTDSIFPRPAKPKESVLAKFGLSERELIDGWRKGGVTTNQFELKASDIYEKLKELPDTDPKGKVAKTLYRWFLEIVDSLEEGVNSSRDNFLKTGTMWGIKSGVYDYYTTSELRHDDIGGLPKNLVEKIAMAELPHRAGAPKVEKVFGIKNISLSSLEQRPKNYRLDIELNSYFQETKPYLYAIRAKVAGQQTYLNKLKKLSLKVCTELKSEITFEGRTIEYSIPYWGWLLDTENDVLYVRSDPTQKTHQFSPLLADSIGTALAALFLLTDGGSFSRLYSCTQADRKALLKRIRGDNTYEDIDNILLEFGEVIDDVSDENIFSSLEEIEDVEVIEEENTNGNNSTGKDSPDKELPLDEEVIKDDEDNGTLEITSNGSQPVKEKRTTQIRVVKRTKGFSSHVSGYKATDGDFAEKKIVEFEEHSTRYPLRVGQIQGKLGFGCDILSFLSKQTRDDFKSGKNRNISLVNRFIEVKGRKNKSAEIELRGNEKDCASKYSDKYYLYRLSKSNEGEYLLSILNNPLSVQEAVEQSIYVHLDMAESTEFLDIKGGIREL